MKSQGICIAIMISLFFILTGCQKEEKPAPEVETLLARAMEYYNGKPTVVVKIFPGFSESRKGSKFWSKLLYRKNYTRALELFNEVIYNYPFSEKAVLAELYIGHCHFNMEEYEVASQVYQDFISHHPRYDELDYVFFQLAMCHYEMRLKYQRDQTETERAVELFQELLSRYPQTRFREDAEKHMKECLTLLAKKDLSIGDFYFRIGEYWSASLRYNRLRNEYPGLGFEPQGLYQEALCYQRLGRKGDAVKLYQLVLEQYPDTRYAKDARSRLKELGIETNLP